MVMSQTDALENFGQFVDVLTMVLGGVAAVSLLVITCGVYSAGRLRCFVVYVIAFDFHHADGGAYY